MGKPTASTVARIAGNLLSNGDWCSPTYDVLRLRRIRLAVVAAYAVLAEIERIEQAHPNGVTTREINAEVEKILRLSDL